MISSDVQQRVTARGHSPASMDPGLDLEQTLISRW